MNHALLDVAVQAESTTGVVDPEQTGIAGAMHIMAGRAFHLVSSAEQWQRGRLAGHKATCEWNNFGIGGREREGHRVIVAQVAVYTSTLTDIRIGPEVLNRIA